METEELKKEPITETLPASDTLPTKPVETTASVEAPTVTGEANTEASEKKDEAVVNKVMSDEPAAVEEPSLLSKYFPNVEVNETNQAELEEAANKLDKLLAINKELATLFTSDPRIGKAIMDFKNGERFDVAVNRYFDFTNIDDTGDRELETARNERITNYEASEKRKNDISANEQASIASLEEFIKTKELDDEGAKAYKTFVITFLDKAFAGKMTPEFFDYMYKLMDYDNESIRIAEEARKDGEVSASNKKIDDLRDKEDSQPSTGLPEIGGGGEVINNKPVKEIYKPKEPFRV